MFKKNGLKAQGKAQDLLIHFCDYEDLNFE